VVFKLVNRISFDFCIVADHNYWMSQSIKNDLIMDTFIMTVPDDYKDLHPGIVKEFPNVTEARVAEYLSGFDKQLEEKSKAMYKEKQS